MAYSFKRENNQLPLEEKRKTLSLFQKIHLIWGTICDQGDFNEFKVLSYFRQFGNDGSLV